ncbi:MICOS complex subunit mic60 [Tilletia horrida]|uniref:MICOS complex subunit MIC60 n=1 Tax=Tilletia horrida TaxID=155126 RepID=A0AAN6GE04_9BASI|nr:MICOS complex subunit mic60 [Tilletia horrida]
MTRALVSTAAARHSMRSSAAARAAPGSFASSSPSSSSASSRALAAGRGARPPVRGFASQPTGPQAGPTLNAAANAAASALPGAVMGAARPALPPPRPPRRFFRTLVGYSLGLTTVFYAGSAVAALNNDRYQDFFVESVPFGETILDQLARNNLDTPLTFTSKDADVSSLTNRAVRIGRSVVGSVSEAVDRTFFQAQEKTREAEHKAREAARSFQERAERAAKDAANQVSAASQRGKEIVSDSVSRGKAAAKDAGEQVKAQADASKSTAASAADRTKELAQGAVAKIQELGQTASNKVSAAASRAEEALPVQGQPIVALPERASKAKAEGKPTIVALPERANRADQDAAAFAKYRTVAAAEQARLQAQQEIERLHSQFEQLKESEAQRAGRLLEEQEAKFRSELAKAQAELDRANKKAEAELRNKDTHWTKELEKEREKQKNEHAQALQQSLDAQNDLIDARLKEEVVARGIELQKKWMAGVKAAVEKERGGRLAQLEQLAEEASVLEKLAKENESIIGEAAKVHTLTAAVRALSSAALGTGLASGSSSNDSVYAYRTPFRAQIDALRSTAKEQSHADVYDAALASLEAGGVDPDEGVESETTLQSWFKRRVAPKVLSVALLPDPSAPPSPATSGNAEENVLAPQPRSPGVFAHLVSATLSPLLAKKTPSEALIRSSEGGRDDDIPTVLARAEFWLDKGQLDDAVREVNRLKGWGKALAADWLVEARKRLVVEQAVELINAEAKLASLRVA